MRLQLVIGNKNYSSWSMRPWVLMAQLGIPFDEMKLRFDFSDGSPFRQAVARYSPAGLVPVLVQTGMSGETGDGDGDGDGDGEFSIWDTLAITEALHELFPQHGVWPGDRRRRARARSLCAELHGGFGALRGHCPMNIEARLPDVGERIWGEHAALRSDVARIESMWADALRTSGGPFLFGAFCAADAFFAPVCMRLLTYALPVSAATAAYVDRVAAAPGVRRWIDDALAEADFLDFEEPYRTQPPGAPPAAERDDPR